MTLINRRHMHSQTHTRKLPATRTRAHKVWWKCYLSISQLNVLISLVAHGCLGKQQSQLQKAESIHLAGCQRRRQRAGLAPLPAPCGGVISLTHSDSQQMPIHTFSLVRRSSFSNFSVVLLFVLVDVVVVVEVQSGDFQGTPVASFAEFF